MPPRWWRHEESKPKVQSDRRPAGPLSFPISNLMVSVCGMDCLHSTLGQAKGRPTIGGESPPVVSGCNQHVC